jgi:mercuric ion transport protein
MRSGEVKRPFLERFGTVGAVVAAAACPICFPKIALVGAAVGLGTFFPFEGYIFVAVQGLFVIAFIGQVLGYRRHRKRSLLAFSAFTTLLLFVGYYLVPSSTLLQLSLAGLLIASVWQAVELTRCARCAADPQIGPT